MNSTREDAIKLRDIWKKRGDKLVIVKKDSSEHDTNDRSLIFTEKNPGYFWDIATEKLTAYSNNDVTATVDALSKRAEEKPLGDFVSVKTKWHQLKVMLLLENFIEKK